MGIVTKCCTIQFYNNIDKDTSPQTYENINFLLIKQIPEVIDSNQCFNYICSKECSNLITKMPRNIFVKSLCKEMNTSEIFLLLKKTINWIISYKIENKKEKLEIKNIYIIQIYTKYGTQKILSELDSLLIKKEENDFLLRSLSDWIMLIQLIINCNIDNSITKGRRERNIKKYVFDGAYFLIKIKNKYIYEQKDKMNIDKIVPIKNNFKISSDTKNEVKKIIDLVQDFFYDLLEYNRQ